VAGFTASKLKRNSLFFVDKSRSNIKKEKWKQKNWGDKCLYPVKQETKARERTNQRLIQTNTKKCQPKLYYVTWQLLLFSRFLFWVQSISYCFTNLVSFLCFLQGTADEVVDCSHGKHLWELCQQKYEPLWLKDGNHCNLELYPEYLRHLRKFISTVEKSPSQRLSFRRSVDRVEQSRGSTDCSEKPRKSTDHRDKPPRSSDKAEKLKYHEFKFNNPEKLEKLRVQFDQTERSRRSVEYNDKSRSIEFQEKSRRSVDVQFERPRKSIDWLDRIRAS